MGVTSLIADLADELRDADVVVALTGAGVSTASGLPDFRGSDGLWESFDPMDFHVRRFREEPAGFWGDILELRETVLSSNPEPNAAHRALSSLERDGYLDAVITQNVDGLHQTAGSEDVIEIHGNIQEAVCQSCGSTEPMDAVRERFYDGGKEPGGPPECGDCGGVLKPASTFFGETLPEEEYVRARELAGDSDVFLAVGSSLTVEPAASLVDTADKTGGEVAVVNLDPTPYDDAAEYVIHEDVTEALPELYGGI